MHDKGNISYTQEVSLEESCYNELSMCDIVICIIGNKYGTKSSIGDYSITMQELQIAIRSRKKIYIYIQKDVYAENFTYLENIGGGFKPYHADNIKIHEFIAELKTTVKTHPIVSFDNVLDITNNLRQQFSGLFQHLLSQEATVTEGKTYVDLQNTAESISNLIVELKEEKNLFFKKFDGTIFAITPVIRKILKLLGGKLYNVFIPNKQALIQFLEDVGYNVPKDFSPFDDLLATSVHGDVQYTLKISSAVFDSFTVACLAVTDVTSLYPMTTPSLVSLFM